MNYSTEDIAGAVIAAFVVGIVLGMGACGEVCSWHYEQEAIKHNAARYNPQTGAFEWIDKEQKGPDDGKE